MSKKLFIVEDNEDSRDLLCQFFEMHGHIVASAASTHGIAEELEAFGSPDVIFSDLSLPGVGSHAEVIETLKKIACGAQIVLISGHVDLKEIASRHGVKCASKPVDTKLLLELLK